MKKSLLVLAALLLLLASCGGDSSEVNSTAADPDQVDVAAEESTAEPALPAPTDEPEPTQGPALITSEEEMAGIWKATLAGEFAYFMYTADGRFLVALSLDALAAEPRVSGEYWFEDNQIHLRDLENAGHWAECDSETVGVYDVVDLGDGKIAFQMIEDSCDTGGFTRSYLFTNMKQEWLAEPLDDIAQAPAAE